MVRIFRIYFSSRTGTRLRVMYVYITRSSSGNVWNVSSGDRNLCLQLVMNVVNLDPGPGSERETVVDEDAVIMAECSPVICEGNAE